MTFGTRMQHARIKKGLTQREVAQALGCETAQFVSNLERDMAPVPAYLIPRLSEILGIPERSFVRHLLKEYRTRILAAMATSRGD